MIQSTSWVRWVLGVHIAYARNIVDQRRSTMAREVHMAWEEETEEWSCEWNHESLDPKWNRGSQRETVVRLLYLATEKEPQRTKLSFFSSVKGRWTSAPEMTIACRLYLRAKKAGRSEYNSPKSRKLVNQPVHERLLIPESNSRKSQKRVGNLNFG